MARDRSEDERLGMFRPITRREFLQGTGLALARPPLARGQSAERLAAKGKPYSSQRSPTVPSTASRSLAES